MGKLRLILLLFGVFCAAGASAQLSTADWVPEWGNAGWSNPAVMHPSGGYLQLPGLSGVHVEADHSGPAFFDFVGLDGAVDPKVLLERMDPYETVGFRAEVPLISFGSRDKEKFEFRFRSRLVAEQQVVYDRDLFDLAWRGNGHPDNLGRPIDLSDMGVNGQVYLDHALSVGAMAKEDKLWLGWGIHLLNGVAAFQTESFHAVWTTDSLDYSWDLESGAVVNAAGVQLDSLLGGGDAGLPGGNGWPNTLGAGVAFDYGFRWRLSPKVEIDGAIEGRGGMRWLESVSSKTLRPDTFIVEGIDLVREWQEGAGPAWDSLDVLLDGWVSDLSDSLEQTYVLESTPGLAAAFDTRVRETWRLGLRVQATDDVEVRALLYRQMAWGRAQEGGLLGVTYRLDNNITASVQCQYHAARWLWGAGLSLRGGPVRLSVSARHVPGLIWPLEYGHVQGQLGLSIDMGYRKDEQKRRKTDLGTGKGMWH